MAAARRSDLRGYLWWALLVIPLWAVLALCVYWEPVMRDGWGHTYWNEANQITPRTIYDAAVEAYRAENPRLGQLATRLSYGPGPYKVIITPIIELGVFALLTALALGRWPSVRSSDDAFAAVVVTALVLGCTPQIGALLFYRPFTGNYTFGLAINLLWLLPYRLEASAARPARLWLAPVMLVLGFAAGLCNEHTGLAFLAMAGLATVVIARRDGWRRLRLWMVTGLAGLTAGYVVLLTAPGQDVRYLGLATKAGILERIVDRGVLGTLAVFGTLALALAGMLPALAVGIIERWRRGPAARPAVARYAPAVLALGGLVCALTLLASPKIGPRLYFASVALIAAGLAGWLFGQLRRPAEPMAGSRGDPGAAPPDGCRPAESMAGSRGDPGTAPPDGRRPAESMAGSRGDPGAAPPDGWAYRLCGALAAATVVYVCARFAMTHQVVGPLGVDRLARLRAAAPDSELVLPGYPYGPSRLFIGDDFRSPELREHIRITYRLRALKIDPPPPN